jgi:hypothetical protein
MKMPIRRPRLFAFAEIGFAMPDAFTIETVKKYHAAPLA